MHMAFKFEFGTVYIHAIEGVLHFFFHFSVLSG